MMRRLLGSWADRARCSGPDVDPEWFHESPKGDYPHRALAKSICAVCPVISDCLFHALRNFEPHGIWGGYDAKERRSLRKRRVKIEKAVDDLRLRYATKRQRKRDYAVA